MKNRAVASNHFSFLIFEVFTMEESMERYLYALIIRKANLYDFSAMIFPFSIIKLLNMNLNSK